MLLCIVLVLKEPRFPVPLLEFIVRTVTGTMGERLTPKAFCGGELVGLCSTISSCVGTCLGRLEWLTLRLLLPGGGQRRSLGMAVVAVDVNSLALESLMLMRSSIVVLIVVLEKHQPDVQLWSVNTSQQPFNLTMEIRPTS